MVNLDYTPETDLTHLQAIYSLLQDLHVRAWRMTGLAARAALELGMHKASFYRDRADTPSHIEFLKDLFACISDLEKRCSFFTNLPSNFHDSVVDPEVLNLVSSLREKTSQIVTANANRLCRMAGIATSRP